MKKEVLCTFSKPNALRWFHDVRGVEVEVLEGMAELESQKRKIDCRDYE